MFLKKKIVASSLAEVVIALAVIALCFGIAALVFVRSMMVTTAFEEVRQQTEIQSVLWEQLQTGQGVLDLEGVQVVSEGDPLEDSLVIESFIGVAGKVIWQQQRLKID